MCLSRHTSGPPRANYCKGPSHDLKHHVALLPGEASCCLQYACEIGTELSDCQELPEATDSSTVAQGYRHPYDRLQRKLARVTKVDKQGLQ